MIKFMKDLCYAVGNIILLNTNAHKFSTNYPLFMFVSI